MMQAGSNDNEVVEKRFNRNELEQEVREEARRQLGGF